MKNEQHGQLLVCICSPQNPNAPEWQAALSEQNAEFQELGLLGQLQKPRRGHDYGSNHGVLAPHVPLGKDRNRQLEKLLRKHASQSHYSFPYARPRKNKPRL